MNNQNQFYKSTIDRREALRRTALIMGGMLSASTVSAILKGCKPQPELSWNPELFTVDQARVITRLADIILPRTDTLGAADVGVPYFIEQVVKDCYDQDEQKRFLDGLNEFITGSEKDYGKPFNRLAADKQEEYTFTVHKLAVEAEKNRTEGYKRPFILKCKELTMAGFFTSEPGATEVLRYEAVPGSYEGCITLEEAGGKAWAT